MSQATWLPYVAVNGFGALAFAGALALALRGVRWGLIGATAAVAMLTAKGVVTQLMR